MKTKLKRIGLSLLLATSLQLSLTTCTNEGRMKDAIQEDEITNANEMFEENLNKEYVKVK